MMAGAYCNFCQRRCFLLRTIPDGPQMGWTGHLATCDRGMALDRDKTGHDHTTACNPVLQEEWATDIARAVGLQRGWFHVTHQWLDAADGAEIEWPDFGPGLWRRNGNRWEPADDVAADAVAACRKEE